MAYIPPTPDIRRDRPQLFSRQEYTPVGSRYAPGTLAGFDPNRRSVKSLPDNWPMIQARLQEIMTRRKSPYYIPRGGGELSPEQEAANQATMMGMAWTQPAGLQAIQTMKYRETESQYKQLDRAEARVAKLEATLLQAHKAEAPQGMLAQLEGRYNKAVDAFEKMLKEDSGYPRYTGEGKLKLKGMEKKPGVIKRLLSAIAERAGGMEVPGMPEGGPPAPAATQAEAPAEVIPEGAPGLMDLTVKGLISAETAMRKHLGNEEVRKEITRINSETRDPQERLEKAAQVLQIKAPNAPETKQLRRQMQAFKMTPERKAAQAESTWKSDIKEQLTKEGTAGVLERWENRRKAAQRRSGGAY